MKAQTRNKEEGGGGGGGCEGRMLSAQTHPCLSLFLFLPLPFCLCNHKAWSGIPAWSPEIRLGGGAELQHKENRTETPKKGSQRNAAASQQRSPSRGRAEGKDTHSRLVSGDILVEVLLLMGEHREDDFSGTAPHIASAQRERTGSGELLACSCPVQWLHFPRD